MKLLYKLLSITSVKIRCTGANSKRNSDVISQKVAGSSAVETQKILFI